MSQLSNVAGIRSTFQNFHERLIVLTRGALAEQVPSMMASLRHVPVLIVADGSQISA
jgi:hypothetical protein